VGNIQYGEHLQIGYLRPGLLCSFTYSPIFHGLTDLQETGWRSPVAIPWLDGSFAYQDAVLPYRDRSNDDLWILVEDTAALPAAISGTIVSIGNPGNNGRPAVRTILHDSGPL
jgi:hypothetical protein